ncbi:MAG TPA: hypothetical protein VFI25_08270 [Planctomycetota bacterium]|nr:hypothetical protein [Planctomycetota bacterium]
MTQLDLPELAAAYLEGTLPLVDRLRFLVRLGTCRALRRYVGALRQVARIVGHTPRVPPTPEAGERILRRFGGWNPRARGVRQAAKTTAAA